MSLKRSRHLSPDGRKQLTERQQMVLDCISQSIERRGYPPTIREIGHHMGIGSTNGVNDHLKALEKKGYLERDLLKSRALKPVDLTGHSLEIPILGRVAAGLPLLAEENIEDRVQIDQFFINTTKPVFGLRVVGESMIGDGINDGDYIFVKKQLTANRGEIVVALIDGEATVKRYYPEGDRIRFQPSNPALEPIYVHKSDFKETHILGVVCGMYRRM